MDHLGDKVHDSLELVELPKAVDGELDNFSLQSDRLKQFDYVEYNR